MDVNKKLYVILIIPALVVFLITIWLLPSEYIFYSLVVPIIFWIIYYCCDHFQKTHQK